MIRGQICSKTDLQNNIIMAKAKATNRSRKTKAGRFLFCPLDGTGCIWFRHRGDALPRWEEAKRHCLPAASRFCNGTEPIQPEDSRAFDGKRGWMPTDFFRSGRTAHSRDGSFGKTGETERIRCGQERRISVFPGQGSRWNAVPLVRGAGGETSGAGQGRQLLVWVQGRCSSSGRAFSADRSGAETDVPCSGSRAESPAQ